MPRSSWNPSLDIVGVEFLGVGGTNSVITTASNARALRFRAQRSGEVDQIAVYAGPGTVNPVLGTAHFMGHRAPYLIELIPLASFALSGTHSITIYPSTILSATNAVDCDGSAWEGNELAQPNDDQCLIQLGGAMTATVHMPGANTFPLNRHVLSVAIEHSFLRQMRVRRIDQNGASLWNRVLPAGDTNWHMGEARIEAGDTAAWKLWTPGEVRQFSSSVGARRLRLESLSGTQSQVADLLRIHVDHIAERRVGVGVMEPTGPNTWVVVGFGAPNVPATPAQIQAGVDYVVIVRPPAGQGDYVTLTAFYERAVADRLGASGSGFQHYVSLDWDLHPITTFSEGTPNGLGPVASGLPSIVLLNDGAQTVDAQPYETTIGAIPQLPSSSSTQAQQVLAVPPGPTVYGEMRLNAFVRTEAPADVGPLIVRLTDNGNNTLAGPFTLTKAAWETFPQAGTDEWGESYRTVRIEFPTGIDINEAAGAVVKFSVDAPSAAGQWRIATLVSTLMTGAADQTAAGAASGVGYSAVTGQLVQLNQPGVRRGDMEVTLLSQPAALTGVTVTVEQQPVSGGVCEPCGPGQSPCVASAIPYAHLCWDPSTLPLSEFLHYEVQRLEPGGDWEPVDVITAAGVAQQPFRGAGGRMGPAISTSQVAPSVDAFTTADLLVCAWQSFDIVGNYAIPAGMTAGPETDGVEFSTMRSARQVLSASGPTGTRTATFSTPDRWSAISVVVRGQGTSPTVAEVLSGVGNLNSVTLNTAPTTQAGDWLLAVQGWDADIADAMGPPSGDGWMAVADSGFVPAESITSRTRAWAKRVETAGAQAVTFFTGLDDVADNHAHLYVLRGVDTLSTGDDVTPCWDDWSLPYGVNVCYRVRQRRVDGSDSDWSTPVCVTVDPPDGADLVITAPTDPSRNVAFPEAHTGSPVERDYEILDADQTTFRAVYGRDGQLAFRPTERLGIAFTRRLLIAALCTPETPCLDVAQGLRDIATAPVPYLVVRDGCGGRWYAHVDTPTVLQQVDPDVGDFWLVDIRVTELATPIIEVGVADV